MARKSKGIGYICDVCGKEYPHNWYFHMILPRFKIKNDNNLDKVDYCLDCYGDLKRAIAEHYGMEWVKDGKEDV